MGTIPTCLSLCSIHLCTSEPSALCLVYKWLGFSSSSIISSHGVRIGWIHLHSCAGQELWQNFSFAISRLLVVVVVRPGGTPNGRLPFVQSKEAAWLLILPLIVHHTTTVILSGFQSFFIIFGACVLCLFACSLF